MRKGFKKETFLSTFPSLRSAADPGKGKYVVQRSEISNLLREDVGCMLSLGPTTNEIHLAV